MKTLCWLLCLSLVCLSACRRKRTTAPTAPETSAPPAAEQPAAKDGSASPAPASPAPPEPTALFDEHFGILTQGLLTFKRDKNRAPRDWQELITTGYLKKMPAAPPGKRYTFNPASLDVHMVNQ
ncbi:MAG: hypothetical protein ABMA26_13785 [Limisphaerales bacterium]